MFIIGCRLFCLYSKCLLFDSEVTAWGHGWDKLLENSVLNHWHCLVSDAERAEE